MSPREMSLRALVKWRNLQDRKGFPAEKSIPLPDTSNRYLPLPDPAQAPEQLKSVLAEEAKNILKGRWTAFGKTEVDVKLPPQWFRDDWAGVDQSTDEIAFDLNHRNLSQGADIKWIWEWSRWTPMLRLAQNAYVNGRSDHAETTLIWLEDWAEKNPPYRGWNWTSALESGMRLIQWRWLDGLLRQTWNRDNSLTLERKAALMERLQALREKIICPHVWSTWRRRSFGSSANNHLLGELTGALLALLVYPEVRRLGISLERVQKEWEEQIIQQFASDGGNREQALNYHLYSWEFGWQGWWALKSAGVRCSSAVESVLARGAVFHREMIEADPSEKWGAQTWPYGDSDDALATPTLFHENQAAVEWKSWMAGAPLRSQSVVEDPQDSETVKDTAPSGGALDFWYGSFPLEWRNYDNPGLEKFGGWRVFKESGYAIYRDEDWYLRWDLSPLGYLSMAAHGHADALHLSVWRQGVAMLVDPGTGAYYADKELRAYLASWSVHNTPTFAGVQSPQRLGPFLWARHHQCPVWSPVLNDQGNLMGLQAQVQLDEGILKRSIIKIETAGSCAGWRIEDDWSGLKNEGRDADAGSTSVFSHWQTPADTSVNRLEPGIFEIRRQGIALRMKEVCGWRRGWISEDLNPPQNVGDQPFISDEDRIRIGTLSPAFRRVEKGPFVRWQSSVEARRGTLELLPVNDN